MTAAGAVAPSSMPSGASTTGGKGPDDDGGAFSGLLAGLDPRQPPASPRSGTPAAASTSDPASTDPVQGAEDAADGAFPPLPMPLTVKGAERRENARTAMGSFDAKAKTAGEAEAPAKLSPEQVLLRALTTPPGKEGKKAKSPGEETSDGQKPDALSPSSATTDSTNTLRMLLGERQTAATDPGSTAQADAAAVRRSPATVTDASAAADDAKDGGPDLFAGLKPNTAEAMLPAKFGGNGLKVDATPRVDVKVLDQATWLPPAVTQDNLRQIADAVLTEAKGPNGAPGALGAPIATNLSSDLQTGLQSHSMVKTLTIQLQPNDLGTLTANLRLSGETMSLHIAASRAETAQMLRADKDKLTGLLKEAGLTASHVVVTIADTLPASAAGNDAESGQKGQFGGQPSGQAFSGGQGGFSNGNGQPDRQPSPGGDRQRADHQALAATSLHETVDDGPARRKELYL